MKILIIRADQTPGTPLKPEEAEKDIVESVLYGPRGTIEAELSFIPRIGEKLHIASGRRSREVGTGKRQKFDCVVEDVIYTLMGSASEEVHTCEQVIVVVKARKAD